MYVQIHHSSPQEWDYANGYSYVLIFPHNNSVGGIISNLSVSKAEVRLSLSLFLGGPHPYGGSQARGPIGAAAADLHHSHSNKGSEPRLRPTPQLMATPDP